jgi:hypothetical protein
MAEFASFVTFDIEINNPVCPTNEFESNLRTATLRG